MFPSDDNLSDLKGRLIFVVLFIFLFFSIIASRLFYLQVMRGDVYSQMSAEVVVREEEIIARRGQILDRRGQVLAETRVYFEITITPQYVKNLDDVVKNLAMVLHLNADDIFAAIRASKDSRQYHPIVVIEDASYAQAAFLSEHLNDTYDESFDLSGVEVRALPVRQYVYPDLFAHVLGYMREIGKEQLEDTSTYPKDLYTIGDIIGVSGLEKQYDSYLKGKDGVKALVVDARGKEIPFSPDVQVIKEKLSVDPVAGAHLYTTLDLEAQKAAKSAFPKDKRGAVVALDPKTGEVLVLYSHPGFDTNRLIKTVDNAYWNELSQSKVLYNLATQGQYPPASTYKPIGVVAGIHEKKIIPESTQFSCAGGLQFGNRFFKCWNKHGHGAMNVITAMAQSCDVFFYRVGLLVGIDGLARAADLLGYGRLTNIDLPSEKSGLIPKTSTRQNLQPSDVLSLAIGQSYNLVTPLQMAKMISLLANGGYEIAPHLAKDIVNLDNTQAAKLEFPVKPTELVGDPALTWVTKGLYEVVNGRGTARRLQTSPYNIAGKTGTAQAMQFDAKKRVWIELENHALFIGFAPYEDPRIAVAVVVEHGGHGGSDAAPVAQAVMDAYLAQEQNVPKKSEKVKR